MALQFIKRMYTWLFTIYLLVVADMTSADIEIPIGYLTAARGDMQGRQGVAISGAITLALEIVNSNSSLLPGIQLKLLWNDTHGDTLRSTLALSQMICQDVAAFFGPEGNCNVEAKIASAHARPMISYRCADYTVSDKKLFPTFARTDVPDTQVTKSVIALINYYNWKKFTIIAEDNQRWQTVGNSLEKLAKQKEMTVQVRKKFYDQKECCSYKKSCCKTSHNYDIVVETMKTTRLYVFLGETQNLVELMRTMQMMQLFAKGEYIVIHVDMMTYSKNKAHSYLWGNNLPKGSCSDNLDLLAARSLLVVVSHAPDDNYSSFSQDVLNYTSMSPFNFTNPFKSTGFNKYVSIYAANLYDSVILYAKALNSVLERHKAWNDEAKIQMLARNGTQIFQEIIDRGSYTSITGADIKIDKNGDSEGNYSVIALKEENYTYEFKGEALHQCNYHMIPVAGFRKNLENGSANGTIGLPEFYMLREVDWPGGVVPLDEPTCGFDREKCLVPDNKYLAGKIAAGTLGGLLFCASLVAISLYRKWKIEQEIEGLLWKIDPRDIHHYIGSDCFGRDNNMNTASKVSLAISIVSIESRGQDQLFATRAKYRGVMVRVKELVFNKKKDISRDVMKEMRLTRELRHDNINSFLGACVEPTRICIITEYCQKGSLNDIVENEDIKLDSMFIASMVHDLIKGMVFLHNSDLGVHGNLKSSNCVVTSRWVLQITDFGLHDLRRCAENNKIEDHKHYENMLWTAPELFDPDDSHIKATAKGDVYAFGIILYEILGRKGPYGSCGLDPKEIVDLVREEDASGEPFRPPLELLQEVDTFCPKYVVSCMEDCWSSNPESRPTFQVIRDRLKPMREGMKRNIMDQMMIMMERYANNLEELVNERTYLLHEEKQKTEDLLHRMLPKPVAMCLTRGDGFEPEAFNLVTIYFSDIVGFTSMSAESTPFQVVNFLNDLYTLFDRIIRGYDVYKVETIGDAYMVVSGLPLRNGDLHAGHIASMSLDLLDAVKHYKICHRPCDTLNLRIGIHTGPVVAGVVGLTMPRYCLFGDTVNTASRMEANGEALKIHISSQCRAALEKIGGYEMEERGLVYLKGKGDVLTHWLLGAAEGCVTKRDDMDLEQDVPLFCRPVNRRSPKLSESRQTSGNVIANRISDMTPQGTPISGSGSLHGRNPRRRYLVHQHSRNRNMIESNETVEMPNSKVTSPAESRRPSDYIEQTLHPELLNPMRPSRSLELFPKNSPNLQRLRLPDNSGSLRREARSLENCRALIQKKRNEIKLAITDINYPNGDVKLRQKYSCNDHDDPCTPLLCPDRRLDSLKKDTGVKRWHSLEEVVSRTSQNSGTRISIKKWLKTFFVGVGVSTASSGSDASLKKCGAAVHHNGFTESNTPEESMV